MEKLATARRTHTCGDLRLEHQGRRVRLAGWVDSRRDHGGLVFVDLRDRFGRTQVIVPVKELGPDVAATVAELRAEYVIQVEGDVVARKPELRNAKLATGEIEVFARSIAILNRAATPPFEVSGAGAGDGEDVQLERRLEHRYVDLRRAGMQRRLMFRHRMLLAMRNHFDEQGFVDVETPILTKSTPEGARDYLVPSRVNPGCFYALPQSPQLFKQLLMIGGFDRYYQIARCFRDEDLRANRQPEFTQLDLEMAFVDEEDIYRTIEGLMAHLWRTVLGKELETPFPRMPYAEALARYGIDKPDLRFGLEIADASAVAGRSQATFLREAIEKGGAARLLRLPPELASKLTRKDLDGLGAVVRDQGAKGVSWVRVEPAPAAGGAAPKLQGTIAKFLPEDLTRELLAAAGASAGDLLLLIADPNPDIVATSLGELRNWCGRRLELIDRAHDRFLWVTRFPFFERDPETGSYVNCRHPFTRPRDEDIPGLEAEPLKVKTQAYDLVMNGSELGSGSIRNHDVALQERVFKILGYSKEESERRFGFLLEALRSGAPPHGGIALGIDRFIQLLAQVDNIREVIAFPKTARAQDLMTKAPSSVDPAQLKMLSIQVIPPPAPPAG